MLVNVKCVGAFEEVGEVATVIEDICGRGTPLPGGRDKPVQISKRTAPGAEHRNICAASSFLQPRSESSLT